MTATVEHRKAFITNHRAGCTCGTVIDARNRQDATQKLAGHLLHPSAANRIAGAPKEHTNCKMERWSDRWAVCIDHNAYVDMDAAEHTDAEQLEMSL